MIFLMRKETMSSNEIKSLTIESLFNDEYIIPIYQRNYAWGKTEIEQLIADVADAQHQNKKKYYIGSLVVYKRTDGKYEVIDGQQRLTTLSLIMSVLGETIQQQLEFEYRQHSTKSLKHLPKGDKANNAIEEGYHIIKNHLYSNELNDNKENKEFKKFLLEKVIIIRTEVPPGTNLNHYFEIMNNRGEQLEKHEIIKSRFMSTLDNEKDRTVFASIWDSCSDMNRYAIMGLEPSQRKQFLNNEKEFDIDKIYNSTSQTNKENTESNQYTIRDAFKNKEQFDNNKKSETNSERFSAIINFSNFLMYTLRIYLEDKGRDINKIPLDDKEILKHFHKLIAKNNAGENHNEIKRFSIILLRTRLLFDNFIIKTDRLDKESQWSLKTPKLDDKDKVYYVDTYTDTDKKIAIMLLSMFHVSYPQQSYKNWLYAVLRGLVLHDWGTSFENYIGKLEQLSDKFYFEVYGNGNKKDFLTVILDDNFDAEISDSTFLDKGTSVPTFIFNRLDYLLWKNWEELKKNQDYPELDDDKVYSTAYFSYQNSVEHYHPQNPLKGLVGLNKDTIDNFGNLCLVTQQRNAKLNNDTPEAKKSYYEEKGRYDSLKQQLMMSYKEWGAKEIQEHGVKMKEQLNCRSSNLI